MDGVDDDIEIEALLLFTTLVVVMGVVDEILFVTAVMVDVYFGSIEATATVLSAIDFVEIFGVNFRVV